METLTPKEVAKILKLHPFSITRLARQGKLPAFKAGGVWRIRKDAFEQWIEKHTHRQRPGRSRVRHPVRLHEQ